MHGILYVDEHFAPKEDRHFLKAGMPVLICVDEVNWPTGIWEGDLVEIGTKYRTVPITQDAEYHLPGLEWTDCKAIITDPRVPAPFVHMEPLHHYAVYVHTSAAKNMLKKLVAAKAEITALKKRLEIERQTLYAALKAATNPDLFTQLETMLKNFQKSADKIKA